MYEELKKLIESVKPSITDDAKREELDTLAEKVHEAYSATITKANDEAAKARVAKKEIETQLKEQFESQIETLKSQVEEAKKSGRNEAVEEYETKLRELSTQRNDLAQKAKDAIINSTLKDVVGQYDWTTKLGAELIVKSHIVYDDEKDTVYIDIDGQRIDPKDGVKKLIETVPDLKGALKAQGTGGSGASGSDGSGNAPAVDPRKITPKEKAEYIKEHGSDAYLKMVSESMGKNT